MHIFPNLCFSEVYESRGQDPHSHVDWSARRTLQPRGCCQTGLALFPHTKYYRSVLQCDRPTTAEEGM